MTDSQLSIEPPDSRMVIVRPTKGFATINFGDLWAYRELVYFMIWRNVKVRYKQTVLGFAWAILRPFLSMVVFSIFFGSLAQMPSDNIPYPIFSYSGLLPWELFSVALMQASTSLVGSGNMITKVYFPRLVLPISSVLSGLVDFVIAFLVLIVMMLVYHITPTPAIWTLPLFLLLALITAIGVSLWLSALNVMYRDINYVLPFINQLWMYITPIVYSSSIVPDTWQLVYALNPMAGVVQGFRWALLGTASPGPMLWISVCVSIAMLISGLFFFRRMEHTFADMV
jgi:lipopolysaccharide transport system permease protein